MWHIFVNHLLMNELQILGVFLYLFFKFFLSFLLSFFFFFFPSFLAAFHHSFFYNFFFLSFVPFSLFPSFLPFFFLAFSFLLSFHLSFYYYYYYYTIWMSLVTGLFFLVLLLNHRWSPPLTLQASHCSTFRIMCDVLSTAAFCSESIECFPGTVSKFFLKLLVTISVAPIITGTIVHFRFHIRCISIHKLLYFNSFSASFCTTLLSAGIATSISVHVFSLFFF